MIRYAVARLGVHDEAERHCEGHVRAVSPLFRFGIVSDIQYADFDERDSRTGKRRYYRAALPSVERAVAEWNRRGVDFALSCGDIVDSVNRMNEQSDAALERVLQKLSKLKAECKHVLGNHCTCQFQRESLLKRLNFDSKSLGYYVFQPHPDWKCIVLDTSDVSVHGWPPDHPNFILAKKILRQINANEDWCNPLLLEGMNRRFVAYNGAVGEEQLKWLKNELESAHAYRQKVIVFTHIPINADMVAPGELLWNYDVLQKTLRLYPSVVKAVISGHVHYWGYMKGTTDSIHYLTLPGVIEQRPGTEAHGIVNVYSDRLTVTGFGREQPFLLNISP